MGQLTGIVTVKLNGALQRSKEGAKLMIGGKERTMQTGYKVYGYTEKVVPSECEFTVVHAAGDNMRETSDLVDITLEFETDTGDTWIVGNASCTNPAEITGGDGEVNYKFAGDPAELA